MEGTCLLQRDNNAIVGITGIQTGERNSEIIRPLTGSLMRRKRLSDITNLASNGRMARSDVSDGQESAKAAAPSASSKDYIAHLLQEKATLMMLLGDRNKIIELSAVEMQKLRFLVQNSNQQNQLLARSNSQMLAEHNVDKDRLKVLHHELGCMSAVLNAKNSELEEKNKLIEQLREAICTEKITEEHNAAEDAPIPAGRKKACSPKRMCALRNQSLVLATVAHQVTASESKRKSLKRKSINLKSELNEPTEDLFEIEDVNNVAEDAPVPAGRKSACNPNGKRAMRNQSLGSASGTNQATATEKCESKRKSLKRKSINLKRELNEPTEDLFEIEDVNDVVEDAPIPAGRKSACNPNRKHALRNQSLGSATVTHQVTVKGKGESKRRSLRRRSSDLKSELNEPTEDLFKIEDVMIVDVEYPIRLLAANDKQSSDRVDSSAPSDSNASWSLFKEELKDHSGPLQNRRRSIGRPMRRAAEKVSCYKEGPLNTKLRRCE